MQQPALKSEELIKELGKKKANLKVQDGVSVLEKAAIASSHCRCAGLRSLKQLSFHPSARVASASHTTCSAGLFVSAVRFFKNFFYFDVFTLPQARHPGIL